MPQMAPLSWVTLMIYFIMLFYLINSLNFYTFIYLNKKSSIKAYTDIKMTWKWL
uniref:ATP synthase F0 subunit 8 n=1 Tax=Leptopalpus rostratus TaxID=2914704 RepID=UPI001FA6F121|nr:ATP synthase F0 subunit 8 [Leptopalpus rostratus]UMR54889.1 ATP synthase F0 subunit 8 [Leptopalpus rostratus]